MANLFRSRASDRLVGDEGVDVTIRLTKIRIESDDAVQVLADELAHEGRVRVATLNPGATRTQMRATAYPGEDPHTVAAPEERMDLYLYLLGPAARGRNQIQWDAKDWSP